MSLTGYQKSEFCLKQGRKVSDFCHKQGQGMRGRAPPPHPRIFRVTPSPGVLNKVECILKKPSPGILSYFGPVKKITFKLKET